MQLIIICALLVFQPALVAYELTPVAAEFYCTVNGRYSNERQMKEDATNRSKLTVQLFPLQIPALSQLPVYYLVETRDGAVLRDEVLNVTIGDDGMVFLDVFNFTDKPRARDPKELKALTPDQLYTNRACRMFFKRIKPCVFFACRPNCRHTDVHGKHMDYCGTFECDMMTLYVPGYAPEKSEMTPYKLASRGPKFPLENAPSNFVCPCDKMN